MTPPKNDEISLDPQDWSALRDLGHRMLDTMMGYQENAAERAAWQAVPASVRAALQSALPRGPQPAEEVWRDFQEQVLPYPNGNVHPRFWGWVNGTGTPEGMLAEMLAAGMNSNPSGFEQSAVYVEQQVLDWLKEMLGFPASASGLLTSGSSMANVVGLAVARQARSGFDVRREGVAFGPRLAVYASAEVHSSVQKAVELLGLGSEFLRRIPVGRDYRIDLLALVDKIRDDRSRGIRPLAVVGCAGTVNTGSVDDLAALAHICRIENLWLHVDGAFGAMAASSPRLRKLVRGLEHADSVAVSLHKWLYVPYDAGCVLVRDAAAHKATFEVAPPYLAAVGGGVAGGDFMFADYGPELSRGFRALKVWMSLKVHGADRYARLVEQNVDQARHLAEKVDASPLLELMAPVPLNVVCFRFRRPDMPDDVLDDLNRELLVRLQEDGIAVPSMTVLGGRFCLRVAITNHRTRREDLDVLVAESVRIGRELVADRRLARAA